MIKQYITLQMVLLSITSAIYIRDFTSVLLGGSAWIIPSLCFIWIIARNPKKFFFGEAVKLLLSAGLIICIISFIHIKTLSFLSGYIAAVSAAFLMPFKIKYDN